MCKYCEAQKILEELIGSKPEELSGETKRLFEAIMKIADERDELLKERKADKEKIEELEKQNEELLEVKISANAHNRICKLEQELMEKELMIDGLKEDRRNTRTILYK